MQTVVVDPFDTQPQLNASEAQLLIACSSVQIDAEGEERIRSLASSSDIGWDRVVDAAREHCVVPLVYKNLSRICCNSVPDIHMQSLRSYYRASGARNMMLASELTKILRLFEGKSIEAVPFKGPMLACDVYGDLTLRSFADLDILIHERDIFRATELLNEMGYEHEYKLTHSQQVAYIRYEHAFHFVHRATGMIIEVHWRLSHRNLSYAIDDAALWRGVQLRTLFGRPVRALKPEDLFLYLCMHGAKHSWERLEWICCTSEFINRFRDLDWEIVAAKARRLGGRRIVAINLLLAATMYNNERARAMLEKIPADRVAISLVNRVNARLFCKKPDHHRREIQRHIFYLQTRERLMDRVRGIVFSCVRTPHPVSMDWQLYHVPASLSFLYYLLRPVRIAREHGVGRLREVLRPDASI